MVHWLCAPPAVQPASPAQDSHGKERHAHEDFQSSLSGTFTSLSPQQMWNKTCPPDVVAQLLPMLVTERGKPGTGHPAGHTGRGGLVHTSMGHTWQAGPASGEASVTGGNEEPAIVHRPLGPHHTSAGGGAGQRDTRGSQKSRGPAHTYLQMSVKAKGSCHGHEASYLREHS